MIEIKNLYKTYDSGGQKVEALQGLDVRIEKGEIFGFIGLSGAGKTSLVRCMSGLETATSGEIWIDGVDMTKLSGAALRALRKKLGMVFQHFNLLMNATVFENVAFPLAIAKKPKTYRREKVRELLEVVGLSDKIDAYPSQLSGGQKQRVGIARALASNPSVLLCDEATSALDPQTTRSILLLLKELNKKLGLTIVIITHEMQVIKSICSHAAVMDDGIIIEKGSVFDIFANPQNEITRDFVAATSHLHKINDLLEEQSPVIQLKENQVLAHFSYQGRNTVDPLISTASTRFKIKLNIIFGDVDIIQDTPIGGLIIILEGEGNTIQETIDWFKEKGVTVEILRRGDTYG